MAYDTLGPRNVVNRKQTQKRLHQSSHQIGELHRECVFKGMLCYRCYSCWWYTVDGWTHVWYAFSVILCTSLRFKEGHKQWGNSTQKNISHAPFAVVCHVITRMVGQFQGKTPSPLEMSKETDSFFLLSNSIHSNIKEGEQLKLKCV